MNLDKITVDDMMEFLDIEEHTRQTKEVRDSVKKFINMFLPTLIEDCPEFIEFCKKKYPEEFQNG